MASVNEVQDLKIRMFKWNEKFHNVNESQGLFMLRVKNPTKDDHGILVVFDLTWLSTRDMTERLVSQAIEGIKSFSEDTTERFRKAMSSHLLSCFRFNIERPPQTRNSTILIVIDVYESRTMNCTRKRAYSSGFPSQKQALKDANDDEKRQVRDARSYKKDLLSWIQKTSYVDDVSPTGSEVKKRKVGDARSYKKELMSRTHRNLFFSEVEEIRRKIRSVLEEPMVDPIATDEPKGLCEVEAAVKVQEFYGREPVDVCSICLDGVSRGVMVAETPCKHFFHRDCLFQWLPNTSCCPLCRSFCATIIQ